MYGIAYMTRPSLKGKLPHVGSRHRIRKIFFLHVSGGLGVVSGLGFRVSGLGLRYCDSRNLIGSSYNSIGTTSRTPVPWASPATVDA